MHTKDGMVVVVVLEEVAKVEAVKAKAMGGRAMAVEAVVVAKKAKAM